MEMERKPYLSQEAYPMSASPGMIHPEKSYQSSTSKHRPSSFLYKIKRDVYNEETFQQEHRSKFLSSGTLAENVSSRRHQVLCNCTWHKFLRCMITIFPFLKWVCFYRWKDWLLGDLLAGLSVGFVQIPQGLALSLLTRQLVPPLNVAFSAFCSSIVYVIFGSCHQMSIGPFFLMSALMINVLKHQPFNDGHLILGTFVPTDFTAPFYIEKYNESLSVVAATTFLTGMIQLSMGVLGIGFMAMYLPEAVVSAYLAAAALHIILSQLPCVFGVMIAFHAGPIAFFSNIINYCVALPKANSTSILLFLTAAVALRISKCLRMSFNHYPIEFPMELILILGFAALANKINMATENSKLFIEMMPFSLVSPTLPDFSIIRYIVLQSISLSLVSSFLLIFLGRKIASFHNYRVNSNQDLIAIGLCNVISACFSSHVFTGAVARTMIQDKSGGRQQFASLVGAGVMLLLMVKVGRFFYELPNVILAAVILINVIPYLQVIYNLPGLWRKDQFDCISWMVTFISTVFLGLDVGLVISLLFAFFIVTVRSHRTEVTCLGQVPHTNLYKSITDYREIAYTERFKYKEPDSSSVNLVHSSHLDPTSPSDSMLNGVEQELSYVVPSTSQRLQEEPYENVERGWASSNSLQKNIPSLQDTTAGKMKLTTPYSDVALQPSTHTIILDFSLVHYVDCRGLVVLRQMCNAFQNANILVLITGCHSAVIREFEKCDFFDHGITKAHLFLTLHDAVLYALSRKAPDNSELSVDEGETVIQETYTESDKVLGSLEKIGMENDKPLYDKSRGFLDSSTNTSYHLPKYRKPKDESLELDLDLYDIVEPKEEPQQMDLDMSLDRVLENEELEELEELEPEAESELEIVSDPQPERPPEPKSTPKASVYSRHLYQPIYQPAAPSTQPQPLPWRRSSEKR
ncbi:testis anion transporter 1 isoform X3 [Cavia porcellus]|uniref:testis anion transporter 1 isoform X3 n=1 Tax=Cavia porcellus TaxID=10141 RepID=UPI002FE30B1D